MPVLVDVFANRSIGWCSLKFPYNQKAKDAIKALPGSRWIDPDTGQPAEESIPRTEDH
jgi:hypothetical protein